MFGVVEFRAAEPRVEAFEGFVSDAVLEGKFGPVLDGGFDFDGVGWLCRVGVLDVEIVLLRVGDDFFQCQNAVNVTFCFFPEQEVVIVLGLLLFHLPGDECLPAIVGCRGKGPAAEAFVCFAEVFCGSFRGFCQVVAFIDFVVDFQSQFFAGCFHDLPDAYGSGGGYDEGFQAAFDDGKVFEVVRDAVGFENGFDNREIAGYFLQYLGGVGMQVAVDNDFPAERFLYVYAVERDSLACKCGFPGHADIGSDGRRGAVYFVFQKRLLLVVILENDDEYVDCR